MHELLITLILFAIPAHAAELSFTGQAEAEQHSYFSNLSGPTRKYDTIIRLQPRLSLKGQQDQIVIAPKLRSNLSSEQEKEDFLLNPAEIYWQYRHDWFRSRIGYNTYNWGIMEGYSPIDILNSKIYFDPLSAEKLGSPSVDLKVQFSNWSLQGVYIPKQPRSILPATDSRWLPREILINTAAAGQTLLLPGEFNYSYRNVIEEDDPRDHNFALRLNTTTSSVDFAVLHYQGNSPLPQFNIFATGTPHPTLPNTININSDIELQALLYKQRTTGGQITWSPGSWLLKLESIYTHTLADAPNIPRWSRQSALGIERSLYIGETSITLLLQGYSGDSDLGVDNLIGSSTRIFDESALLGLRFGFSTRTSLTLSALYDFANDSSFITSIFSTRLWRRFNLNITGTLIEGAEDSLLGSYNTNDRIKVTIAYNW